MHASRYSPGNVSDRPGDQSGRRQQPVGATPTPTGAVSAAVPAMRVERLPLRVRIVADDASLYQAVRLRQAAYGRHVQELARTLGEPEPSDRLASTVVLLAESNLDGEPLGTMRIQHNDDGPLGVEQSVLLPPWLQGRRLTEATRLAVVPGSAGTLTKTVLFKAYYLYCLAARVEAMVVVARAPLDRQYSKLLFDEVFPEQGFIPMRHVGNIAHRVFALEVSTARERWAAARHPLYDFMVNTQHPDILLNVG